MRAGLAVSLLLTLPSVARGFERSHVEDNQNVFLYWPDRTITVTVSSAGSQDVDPGSMRAAVMRSLTTWTANACTDLYLVWGGLTANRTTNLVSAAEPDRVNTLVWREDDWPAEAGPETLALTTLVYDYRLGAIIDGDIDFNGQEFFWTTTDDRAEAATDVQNTVTHELGHLIGLDHSSDPDSTMFGSTEQSELSKRELGEDDLEGLCYMYPSGDDTPLGTVTASPAPLELAGTSCAAAPGASPSATVLLLLLATLALNRKR